MARVADPPIATGQLYVPCRFGMTNPRPSNAKSDIVRSLESASSETEKTTGYRCPVCGKIVDPADPEQILLHHEHVTHPRDFFFAKPLAA